MCESLVRLRNQVEVLLEQAQIKLSSVVSDLFGKSGRRMLEALLQGIKIRRSWPLGGTVACMRVRSNWRML
jgi:hypothetical protein